MTERADAHRVGLGYETDRPERALDVSPTSRAVEPSFGQPHGKRRRCYGPTLPDQPARRRAERAIGKRCFWRSIRAPAAQKKAQRDNVNSSFPLVGEFILVAIRVLHIKCLLVAIPRIFLVVQAKALSRDCSMVNEARRLNAPTHRYSARNC